MLTQEQLRTSPINPEIAAEAYDQAAKRLDDVLETKKSFEDKALALLGAYVTVSVALFGVVGLYLKEPGMAAFCVAFTIGGTMFAIGAVAFLLALPARLYGAKASSPAMWLVQGIIDGGADMLPYMQASIARFHYDRIALSERNNIRKAGFLFGGILIGAAAPFVLLAVLYLY